MTAAQETGQFPGPSSLVPHFTKGTSIMREGTGGLGELLHHCDPSHGFSPYEHTWPFLHCVAHYSNPHHENHTFREVM